MKYVCTICGYVYDEEIGIPDEGINPGTKFSSLPDDWVCPNCGAPKALFEPIEEKKIEKKESTEDLVELNYGTLAILCNNLAKGCEKQYLFEESNAFKQIADYYELKCGGIKGDFNKVRDLLGIEENNALEAKKIATMQEDRGALRVLTWGQKVNTILSMILDKYNKEGIGFIEGNKIFVCEVCGFIYVGKEAPLVCPVCKVPNLKIHEIGGNK